MATFAGLALLTAHASAQLVTSGLMQHLNADTGVAASGTNVTSWAPVGGIGDTVNTSFGSPQLNTGALNGHNTISFTQDQMNGSNLNLFDFGTGDMTWFAVVNYASSSGNGTNVFGTLQNNLGFDGLELDSNGAAMSARFRSLTTDPILTAGSDTRNSWAIYTGRRTGGTVQFYINGVLQTSAPNAGIMSSDAFTVGSERTSGGERANFDIAFLGVYNTSMSTGISGTFNQMGTYLEQQYGLNTAFEFVAGATTSDVIAWTFENNNLGNTSQTNFFTVTSGTAFDQITDGTASQPIPYNLLDGSTATVDAVNANGGNYLVRTDFAVNFPAGNIVTKPGDGAQGVMQSGAFTLPQSTALIGLTLSADMAGDGGALQLIRSSDNAVLATLDPALQSVNLQNYTTDILAFAGQNVYLRLLDDSSGGWGHIAVDNIFIRQTLAAVPEPGTIFTWTILGTFAAGLVLRKRRK